MREKPLLSICIPTYNRSEWLEACLMAWAPQIQGTQGLTELVVCDNCSTDQTEFVVKKMQEMMSFRYYRNDVNLGPIGNNDRLVRELALGEFAWVVGDDDIICEDALQFIVNSLQANLDIDYFYVNYCAWSPKDTGEVLRDFSVAQDGVVLSGGDTTSHLIQKTADLISGNILCFTQTYVSIIRRTLYQYVFEEGAKQSMFTSLSSTFPHSEYIVSHLLQKPAFYIGRPSLISSVGVSWGDFLPITVLHWLPNLYDLAERHGADRAIIDQNRRMILRNAHQNLAQLLFSRKTKHRNLFSFRRFFLQHLRFIEFWGLLIGVMKNIIYESAPSPIRKSWHRLKPGISGSNNG